jgi:hypothetical protein
MKAFGAFEAINLALNNSHQSNGLVGNGFPNID